uniref:Mitochondrial import inner membrane translocase subunit TIM23 n=1 Tax=Jaculus jaculus TaxID=51337 RepID=A0A8C5K0W4_JACJA
GAAGRARYAGLRRRGTQTDPRYLVQDTDEFILPTGANETRGRFELAFFTIGGCCMAGAAFGALNGLRLGLKETQNMAGSKPRNVQIMNVVTKQGALWANTLGSLALLYSAFGVITEKTRGAEDDLNTVAAGTMTGMLYKCPGGLPGVAQGGLAGLTLTSVYALWWHMHLEFICSGWRPSMLILFLSLSKISKK